MKQRVKLTESNIHRIIAESVKKVLKEVAYRPTNAFIKQEISNLDKYQKSETVLRAISYRILKMTIILLDKQYQFDCEQLNELVNLNRDANGVEYFEPICVDVLNKAGVEPFKYAFGRIKNLVSSYCTYCQENPDQEISFREWHQIYLHDNAVKNCKLYNSNLVSETDLHRIVKESIGGVLNESTAFDRKIPEVIEFLEELATRLDNGLLSVNGFEGGNRMFASSSLRDCVKYLKKMNGNLVATDTVAPI